MDKHRNNIASHDEFILDVENLKFLAQLYGQCTHAYQTAYDHIYNKWVGQLPDDSGRHEIRKKFLEGLLIPKNTNPD